MDPLSAWRAVRAVRWWVLVVVLVGGLVGVVLPVPTVHGRATDLAQVAAGGWGHYEASAVVGVPPGSDQASAPAGLAEAEFYASSSAVSDATVAALHLPVSVAGRLPRILRLSVVGAGQAQVTGLGSSPQQAADVANAFASALVAQVSRADAQTRAAAVAAARKTVGNIEVQIASTSKQLAALGAAATGPSATAISLRDGLAALRGSYQAAYTAYETAQTTAASAPPTLASLQSAQAGRAAYLAPRRSLSGHHLVRGLAGLIVGLVLGALLALLRDLRRPRLRSRAAVERAFAAPVVVELPAELGSPADAAVRLAPTSRSAEAYRVLRTVLVDIVAGRSAERYATESGPTPRAQDPGNRSPRYDAVSLNGHTLNGSGARVLAHDGRDAVFVEAIRRGRENGAVAAGGADGSTGRRPEAAFHWWGAPIVLFGQVDGEQSLPTVVGNVAAAVAETGRRAIVVRIAPAGQRTVVPLGDAPIPRPTGVPNVWVVELDARGGNQLTIKIALRQLAARADVLLVEMGSVLSEHICAALGPLADVTVVVAEAGRTQTRAAAQAALTLRRLGVPLRGVIFTGLPPRDLTGRHDSRRDSLRLPAVSSA